jgi:pSer/pThr/pTyr-binding forkhead associated (FHA) protein
MPDLAHVEVVFSGQPRRVVPISELPFFIGRGSENGNHLTLDDARISRNCIVISAAPDGIKIEDRGQRGGIFVNGQQVTEGEFFAVASAFGPVRTMHASLSFDCRPGQLQTQMRARMGQRHWASCWTLGLALLSPNSIA